MMNTLTLPARNLTNPLRRLGAPALVALALTACGGGDIVSATIGDGGGTLTLDDGTTIEIPAGALTEDVIIGAEIIEDLAASDIAPLPSDLAETDGRALVLTPHGTRFNDVVRITLPTSLTGSEIVAMYLENENDTVWKPAGPLTVSNGQLHLQVSHFSVISAGVVAAGACPCWTGADLAGFRDEALAQNATHEWHTLNTGGVQFTGADFTDNATSNVLGDMVLATDGSNAICRAERLDPLALWVPDLAETAISVSEYASCDRLMYSAFAQHNPGNVQVAAYATGLAAGTTVDVLVDYTTTGSPATLGAVSLDLDRDVVWFSNVHPTGTTYSARIANNANCTIPQPTGTMGTENVAIEVVCTPPAATGCSIAVSGTGDLAGVTWADTDARCSLVSVTDVNEGPLETIWVGLMVHDADIPTPFGVESDSPAAWDAYRAGGGSLFGIIPFSSEIPDGETLNSSGTVTDGEFIGGQGLGVLEFTNASTYELSLYDSVNSTFSYTSTLQIGAGYTSWPPTAGSVSAPLTGTVTVTASGDFEVFAIVNR